VSRVLRALKVGWVGFSAFLGALFGRSARDPITGGRSDVSGGANEKPRDRPR